MGGIVWQAHIGVNTEQSQTRMLLPPQVTSRSPGSERIIGTATNST
jgi:hypothetical protein